MTIFRKNNVFGVSRCTVCDDGTCKHCVALLFSLHSFSERHRDRGIEVCTDKECTWDKPRRTSHPVVVQNLSYHSKRDSKDKYVPVKNKIELQSDDAKSLYRACKRFGSVFVHTMDPPSDMSDEDDLEQNIAVETQSIQEIIAEFKTDHAFVQENEIIDHLKHIFSDKVIDQIENETKDQSDSDFWHRYRKGRITASIMGSILKCRMDKLDQSNYITKRINGESNLLFTAATMYGKKMEAVAFQQYSEQYLKKHDKVKIDKSGLMISTKYPFIAASPDGLVSCNCCGKGVIEIKCSFTHQNKYVDEIAENNNYHVMGRDGKITLNKNSSWYAQLKYRPNCIVVEENGVTLCYLQGRILQLTE